VDPDEDEIDVDAPAGTQIKSEPMFKGERSQTVDMEDPDEEEEEEEEAEDEEEDAPLSSEDGEEESYE
jgi:hypothetical protein